MKIIPELIIMLFAITSLFAQKVDVREYLKMIYSGKSETVKSSLLDLIAEYPDDPGVIYLFGCTLEDSRKSLIQFRRIVEKFPESEWVDDAYYRIILHYISESNFDAASEEFNKLKTTCPDSDLIFASYSLLVQFKNSGKPTSDTKNSMKSAKKDKTEQVEPLKKGQNEPSDKQSNVPESHDTSYGLQIGVFSNQQAAKKELDRYTKERLYAEIIIKEVNSQKMYAVVIGNYTSKKSAEEAKATVKSYCSCDPIVVRK